MVYVSVGSPGSPKTFSVRRVGAFLRFIRFLKRILFIRVYIGNKHLRWL